MAIGLMLLAGLTALWPTSSHAEDGTVVLTYDLHAGDVETSTGQRLAEALAAGPGGRFVAREVPAIRANALLDAGAPACAVLHARSEEREPRRQWVVKMAHSRTLLASLDPGTEQPAEGEAVAALAGTPFAEVAGQNGFPVEPVRTRRQIFQMLRAGRVRFLVEDELVLQQALREGNLDRLHIVRELARTTGWLACSPGVPDDLVEALRARVAELRADGTLAEILSAGGYTLPDGSDPA